MERFLFPRRYIAYRYPRNGAIDTMIVYLLNSSAMMDAGEIAFEDPNYCHLDNNIVSDKNPSHLVLDLMNITAYMNWAL